MQELTALLILCAGVAILFRLIRVRTALLLILGAALLLALGGALPLLQAPTHQASTGPLIDGLMVYTSLKQLFLILLGIGVMVGLVSRKKALRIMLRMLLMPFVLLIGWYFLLPVWQQLTPLQCFIAILIAVPATAWYLLVHTAFGREVLASILGNFFYDVMRHSARFFPWILLGLVLIGFILSLWS